MKKKEIGKNCHLESGVILGHSIFGKKPSGISLKIGDNVFIRSGTIIYLGSIIGNNFQTGHNAVIREGNIIGNNVVVGTNSYLGPGNKIGNNVKIHTGCFLERVTLEDNVVVTPHVVFTDDLHPHFHKFERYHRGAIVRKNAAIGANATILPNIEIGENALVGAGSVVTKNVPKNSVVVGNPARVIKKISDLK